MSNRIFIFFMAFLLALGIWLGCFLAGLPTFSIPAILNVGGIAYTIFAVIVLYETVAENPTFKRIIVSYVAPILLWGHTVIPLGVVFSWLLIRESPHSTQIAMFGWLFFWYSILPLSLLDATVTFPRVDALRSVEGRHRRFGLFLVLTGLGMQFIAALLALLGQ